MDSYDIGRFPPLWSEWNGRFRDTVRNWWRSRDGLLPDLATRLCGSADIYDRPDEGRRPSASVNFVNPTRSVKTTVIFRFLPSMVASGCVST